MSCQKGNSNRSRPQKYQNSHAFKNTLHDTSHRTKFINKIQVVNVCERCKKIIEWKIKYKKYKPLKAPSKCTKCNEKSVKHAYHTICGACALENDVCPKCGEKVELIKEEVKEETVKLDRELRLMLKKLPERKRRTFMRYMNRKAAAKSKNEHDKEEIDDNDDDCSNSAEEPTEEESLTRDDLLKKLQSLMVSKKPTNDADFDDDDTDEYSDSDDSDDKNVETDKKADD